MSCILSFLIINTLDKANILITVIILIAVFSRMAVSNYSLMIPTPYDRYTICFYSFGPGMSFNGTKILGVTQGHYCAAINEYNITVS